MATVRLKLWTYDGPLTSGAYPVVYYCRYSSKPYKKRTGYVSFEKDWSIVKQNIKVTHSGGAKLQKVLQDNCVDYEKLLTQQEALRELDFKKAWDIVLVGNEPNLLHKSFNDLVLEVMDGLLERGDLGNYKMYDDILASVVNFTGDLPVDVLDFDYKFVKSYVFYYSARGNVRSTLSIKIRTLKAMYKEIKRMYKKELLGWEDPFDGIGKFLPAAKPSVDSQGNLLQDKHQPLCNIKKMMDRSYSYERQMAFDFWLALFYLRGAGLIDLLYISPGDLIGEYYYFNRGKMPKKNIAVRVKIEPEFRRIVEKYSKPNQLYVFPYCKVPRNDTTVIENKREGASKKKRPEGTRQYYLAIDKITKMFIAISNSCNYPFVFKLKEARHSWVVAARDIGIQESVITQCIGHKEQSVLKKHYFGQYPQEVLDEANRKVLDLLG